MVTMTRIFETFCKCFKRCFVYSYNNSFAYTKKIIPNSDQPDTIRSRSIAAHTKNIIKGMVRLTH